MKLYTLKGLTDKHLKKTVSRVTVMKDTEKNRAY